MTSQKIAVVLARRQPEQPRVDVTVKSFVRFTFTLNLKFHLLSGLVPHIGHLSSFVSPNQKQIGIQELFFSVWVVLDVVTGYNLFAFFFSPRASTSSNWTALADGEIATYIWVGIVCIMCIVRIVWGLRGGGPATRLSVYTYGRTEAPGCGVLIPSTFSAEQMPTRSMRSTWAGVIGKVLY